MVPEQKKKHIWLASMVTLGGLAYIAVGLLIQADLNWARAYDSLMYLLGKSAALTVFSLVLLWVALLINHSVEDDWFAIENDLAKGIVWGCLFLSMSFAWSWG
jgi:hypothetical protein